MMLPLTLLIFVLISQFDSIQSSCQKNPLCRYNGHLMTITCNSKFAQNNITLPTPDISCFPPVNTYVFLNFEQIQAYTFYNLTFPANETFTIKLLNVSTIESDTFSETISLPNSSQLSIEIGEAGTVTDITIKPNAFNQIKIHRLHFLNLNTFNGHSTFDTNAFGNNLQIDVLLFDQCNLTSFSNLSSNTTVNKLILRNSPSFTQLTSKTVPSFLPTIKSLEISTTGLQSIDAHTFQAWSLILEEFILTNNSNLESFPPAIVDGVLMKLNKVDISDNSIKMVDANYDWLPYSYTKDLALKNQQLDLFLRSNMLKMLPFLQKIDLSGGYLGDDDENLFKSFFPNLTNLTSLDISYTNLTETMIIDVLTKLSQTTTRFVDIYLRGQHLTDENFCSYFTVYKNAPSLLNLFLDQSHPCNCIVELFYRDTVPETRINNSMSHPACLLDSSRQRCNIQAQISVSNCQIGAQKPDTSDGDNDLGDYAFGAVVAGVVVVLLVMLSLGYGVYQIRRRRNTVLTMEQPVENPQTAIVEERLSV
ncbi:unnamed protein product [Adineta ricciae]|uniref:Uncharacterized protein n=1 Tax=Adineta ricciae TaxID=249248 RepID=A0A813QTR2_ADIRI|nr:unnamed protein product [Adineta ricciae]CAF0946064.1 unnamed protein product [Adineta ricciae]